MEGIIPVLISARIVSDNGSAEVAMAVEGSTSGTALRFWVRQAPSKVTTPRWSPHNLPVQYWPSLGSTQRSTAAGTLVAAVRTKIANGSTTIEGLYVTLLTEQMVDDLSTHATAASVFGVVNKAMEEPAPRKVDFPSLNEAILWLLDGPLQAVAEGRDLATWTTTPENLLNSIQKPSPKKAAPAATGKKPVSPEDVPVMVETSRKSGGKTQQIPYYPYFIHNGSDGQPQLNTEFLWDCYNVGDPETVAIHGIMGVGKSMLVAATFQQEYKDKGVNFYDEALIVGSKGMTEWDICGGLVENPVTGRMELVEGKLPKCMKRGVKLFFDEAFLVQPAVYGKILPALDARGILERSDDMGGTVHAAEGFGVIFGGNLGVQGATVFDPLWARFHHTPEMTTHWPTVHKVLGPQFDPFITVLRVLDEMRQEGLLLWSPQFREAVMAKTAVEKHGANMMIKSLLKKFKIEQDRQTAWEEFRRVMKIGPVPDFRI